MPRRLVLTVAAPTDKVLAAGASSFPLSGQAATLRVGRVLAAAAASFPLVGQAASFRKGLRLVAGAASFPLTGQAATLRRTRIIAAGVAAFPLTGIAATLRKGLTLVAGATSFPLTGQAATLRTAKKLAAAAASFPLTGQAATLTKSGGVPTIVNDNGYNSAGSSVNPVPVALPASIVAGNKLVVLLGQPGQAVVTTPAGWTPKGTYGGTGSLDRKLYVFEKVADGSEGSTLNITLDTTRLASAVSMQINGSSSSTLIAGTNATGVDPDPPVNNPGSSAATLWVAAACKRQTAALTVPSGYTIISSAQASSTVSVAAASKTATASSEDPGVFTGSGSDVWAAATLGFRA